MFGFGKRILMIGNEGVVLFGPSPMGGIERETAISWEVPNFNQQLVAALIKQNIRKPVLMLFDGSDNTFRKETNLPKLNPFDRKKYIKRKLDQAFSSYPFRTFIDVTSDEEKKEKKPISYLFVAITDLDKINKVTECLLEAGVHISGLGILSIEAEGLIKLLAEKLFGKEKRSRWAILAGQHEGGGLRQVIIKDGRMAFTRITPTSEAGVQGESWANEFINEYKATETYLSRLAFKPEEGLDVIVVCGAEEKKIFESKNFVPGNNFKCVTADEALKQIGFKRNLIGSVNFADSLYAAWCNKKSSLSVPVSLPSIDNIKWPRRVASVFGVLTFLGILGMAYYSYTTFDQYILVGEDIDRQQGQKRLLTIEYDEEAKVFKQFPVTIEVVRGTLAVNSFLNDNVFKITPTLNVLRSVLPRDIKLESLKVEYLPPKNPSNNQRGGDQENEENQKRVSISFEFTLVKNMPLEDKVIRAENLIILLQGRLPGYKIVLKEQFANVSRDEGFSGSSDEAASGLGKSTGNERAAVTIEGPAL